MGFSESPLAVVRARNCIGSPCAVIAVKCECVSSCAGLKRRWPPRE
jgi:hypothetical protein